MQLIRRVPTGLRWRVGALLAVLSFVLLLLGSAHDQAAQALGGTSVGDITIVKVVDGPPPATDWQFMVTSVDQGCSLPTPATIPAAGGTTTVSVIDETFAVEGSCQYTVSETTQVGWDVDPASAMHTGVRADDTVTFTNTAQTGSISGYKFEDLNGNGLDDGEPRLDGVIIRLVGGGLDTTVATGPNGAYSFTGLFADTYTVSETVPSGYAQTSGGTAITLNAGEDYTGDPQGQGIPDPGLVFGNVPLGRIEIVKDTVPDSGQDFSFTASPLVPSTFDLDDDADGTLSNTQVFTDVLPGSYVVAESSVPGFFTNVSCVDPSGGTTAFSGQAIIDLAPGETVTCTFTNTALGQIVVIKDTVPDDPQDFDFEIPSLERSFTLDDDADATLSNTETITNVDPGTYDVTELAVSGYDTTVSCDDPDGGTTIAGATATVDLDPGETVTCTYTNAARGTIQIIKDTVPDSPDDFSFTATGGLAPAAFDLDDDADGTLSNTQTFTDVVAGTYTVSELAAAGFAASVTCIDPDGGTTTVGSTATIDLDPGESVTCTFTNAAVGTIVVLKDTVPDLPDDFSFTAGIGLAPASFSLDDDADATLSNTQTFSAVPAGSYTITEQAAAGFLTALACVDPDGGTSTFVATATIDLDAGETVTCTFTNTALGTIEVIKDTVPDAPQDFEFSALPIGHFFSLDDDADAALSNTEVISGLVAGSYLISETAVAGYDTTVSCVDPDGETTTPLPGTAVVDVDFGETVTCTFTNTARGTIEIIKDTVPDLPDDFSFITTGGLSPTAFDLDDDADATLANTQTFVDVAPGTYSVTEDPAAGFDTALSCVDPDGGTTVAGAAATIDLDAGETVRCTFTNTALGTIAIVKDTVPDSGQDFSFTTTGGLSPATFELDDDADLTLDNAIVFTDVAIGAYTVTELAADGFDATVVCDDPDGGSTTTGATANIDLDAGELVTCTFTNAGTGSITIIEDTVPDGGQDFSFSSTGPSGSETVGVANLSVESAMAVAAQFLLDDDADAGLPNQRTFSGLAPGTYVITQSEVAFYTTTISCTDPDGETVVDGLTASIDLDAGESITCTFANTRLTAGAPGLVAAPAPPPPPPVAAAAAAIEVVESTILAVTGAESTVLLQFGLVMIAFGSYVLGVHRTTRRD